ncbi:UNVERIFIED_CONTAM: hypothetical protein NCL1_01157 [Trichonephila clavipes]
MGHVAGNNRKLLSRVRRIRGQAEALEKVLTEPDADCRAVLQQIAALRGAAHGLMVEVLDAHIREHLGADDLTPAQRAEEMEDVLTVVRSYLR